MTYVHQHTIDNYISLASKKKAKMYHASFIMSFVSMSLVLNSCRLKLCVYFRRKENSKLNLNKYTTEVIIRGAKYDKGDAEFDWGCKI